MWKPVSNKVTIRVTVVLVFVIGTLVTAATAISLQYFFSTRIATTAVTEYATTFSSSMQKSISGLNQKTSQLVELLAHNPSMISRNEINRSEVDTLFTSLLKSNNELYAAYIGESDGDFYELINLDASPLIRGNLGASPTDRFAKIIVEGEGKARTKTTIFLNEHLFVTSIQSVKSEYDASVRPWFLNANRNAVTKSEPYLFQHLQSSGQTFSMQVDNSDHVVALDIALSTLSDYLAQQIKQEKSGSTSEVYLYDSQGTLTASDNGFTQDTARETTLLPMTEEEREYVRSLGTLRISNELDWAPLDFAISGEPQGYFVEKTQMLANNIGLSIEYVNGVSWDQLVQYFHNGDIEILAPVYRTDSNKQWGAFSDVVINMEMAVATRLGAPHYRSLADMSGKTIAIPKGWSIIPEIRKNYPDITVQEVAAVIDALQAVLQGHADAAIETEITLQYAINNYHLTGINILTALDIAPIQFDNGLRYLVSPEHQPLLNLINRSLKAFEQQDIAYLQHKWLHDLNGLTKNYSTAVPYNELITLANSPTQHGTLQELTINGQHKFVFVSPLNDVRDQFFAIVLDADEVLAPSKHDVYVSTAITGLIILCLLPFSWLFANPIVRPVKLLARENNKIMNRQYKKVVRRRFMIKEIDELSESLVKMSEAIAEHSAQQQALMDSFVELIAQAIDDKSPYTGGHCLRVPELGLMLANVASESDAAHFSDFSIADEDKRREFRLAAWLHDCGKITTPEHVVDKGSKLETNYNRIHEIRTRFEVLWRDIEIEYYRNLVQHPEQQAQLIAEKTAQQSQLIDDYAFVAKCNVGGEAMEEESITRLNTIAKTTWVRNFDDCIGLSPLEEKRRCTKPTPLPVVERLLDDRPEHMIKWERKPEYNPDFNITLQPPALQNNQGELYNLSTRRGTLNNEERYRINEHVVSTIKILDSLPFPPELANVPRYASSHHETLKGTGYPRGLTADELSIGERILVLADIFEALTADDRPYKKAKPLSVALKIMRNMVNDAHIDKEVFNLFLNSGVYLDYANKYLSANQIDEIELADYLV